MSVLVSLEIIDGGTATQTLEKFYFHDGYIYENLNSLYACLRTRTNTFVRVTE